jgi:hypothetical protein
MRKLSVFENVSYRELEVLITGLKGFRMRKFLKWKV